MRYFFRHFNLQLFGGEGASSGGDGGAGEGAPGVGADSAAADAGQAQALEALGVPKDRLDRYKRAKAKASARAEAAPADDEAQQAASAQIEQTYTEQTPEARDYDAEWKTIQDDPEFNRRMQDIVNKRVKSMKGQLDELTPALELLARKYGLADTSDTKSIVQAITGDRSFYEDEAIEMGTDTDTAMRIHQREAEAKRREAQANETIREQMLRSHFENIKQQAAALSQKIPGFSLEREMQNERFVRMTQPGGGFSVEEAFYALHHREIEAQRVNETAQRTAQALSNSIQAGKGMPTENGTTARAAANVQTKPYSQMSKDERAEFKRRLMAGGR